MSKANVDKNLAQSSVCACNATWFFDHSPNSISKCKYMGSFTHIEQVEWGYPRTLEQEKLCHMARMLQRKPTPPASTKSKHPWASSCMENHAPLPNSGFPDIIWRRQPTHTPTKKTSLQVFRRFSEGSFGKEATCMHMTLARRNQTRTAVGSISCRYNDDENIEQLRNKLNAQFDIQWAESLWHEQREGKHMLGISGAKNLFSNFGIASW